MLPVHVWNSQVPLLLHLSKIYFSKDQYIHPFHVLKDTDLDGFTLSCIPLHPQHPFIPCPWKTYIDLEPHHPGGWSVSSPVMPCITLGPALVIRPSHGTKSSFFEAEPPAFQSTYWHMTQCYA